MHSGAVAPSSSKQNHPNEALYTRKHHSGTFRVVSDECTQFSLDEDFEDEDNDMELVLESNQRHLATKNTSSNQPLIPANGTEHSVPNGKADTSIRKTLRNSDRELSRLTDEVEIDGDSASDELDLLPPLPPNSRKGFKWSNIVCCKSRVPMKCHIM
uniref:Uncharacterized protein n=1 Tax=Syphacia muris TaxID=451379 RepID=A0A0N5ALS3_9BILA